MQEKMEEQKVLRGELDKALQERSELEVKWKKDFEQIRNVNTEREERLLEDCEWKMRSMQKQCKEKLDSAEKEKKAALEKLTEIQSEWEKHSEEVRRYSCHFSYNFLISFVFFQLNMKIVYFKSHISHISIHPNYI